MADELSTSPDLSRRGEGKEPGALRTIGEVATALGLRQHVLRYWEQQFPMLRPLKRSGGRRYYRAEDVELLARIDRLINREGYTLKGARSAIERGAGTALEPDAATSDAPTGAAPEQSAPSAKSAVPEELLPALRRIRSRLATALQA